jgi:hypothetical protein
MYHLVSAVLVVYHSHTTEGRGSGGDSWRREQPKLVSLLEDSLLGGWQAIGDPARRLDVNVRVDIGRGT